jgi:hypothetical protein
MEGGTGKLSSEVVIHPNSPAGYFYRCGIGVGARCREMREREETKARHTETRSEYYA